MHSAPPPLFPATITMLNDARAAYHSLVTGASVVRFKDSNGEEVEYAQSTKSALLDYIKTLYDALYPSGRANGPMRLFF